MIYPYQQLPVDDDAHFLPLIPVTVIGPALDLECYALVDSGSDQNVIDAPIAHATGISLTSGAPVIVSGLGDSETNGTEVDVEFRLGRQTWTAPVVFVSTGNQEVILGQLGFFAFFDITFWYQQRTIDIRKVRS